mmetsp:Transcript_49960/g.79053  ORF Transcript_49960/g.79053 Transcript_49960/m.79053 type:complete len:413 (-) Transcript_49960:81-1319(-)
MASRKSSFFWGSSTFLACVCFSTVVAKIHFEESFSDGEGWRKRWYQSNWRTKKSSNGNFTVEPIELKDDHHIKGGSGALTVQGDHQFFTVVAPFEPFSNRGKMLIIQFTINMRSNPICGNFAIKVGPKLPHLNKFSRRSPYHIMFGPYYCGNRNHITELRFSYNNRSVSKTEDLPFTNFDRVPVRYRLTIFPDNTVKLDCMGKEKYRGSLEQDWKLLEPITIDDETDTKPASWVDNIMQVDVGDRKPADWIDHKRIPDHTMSRPAKWDEAEDGVWMPTKPNPEYKGEWRPRMVRNPEYLGEWKKRKIPNPKYKPDAELYRYDDIAYIALDFFSVLGGTQFDDFLICDTEAEADEAVKHWESWEEQLKAEFFQKRKNMPLVQQMWDDKSEVEDYDEDDEEVPIMPRKPMRPEL